MTFDMEPRCKEFRNFPPRTVFNPWRSMDSAPKNRMIQVFAHDPNTYGIWNYSDPANPDREEHGDILEDIICMCQWHPDAGFCVCELRVPILWREIE